MKFSASELVKRSASQLLYKEIKKIEWQTTKRQFKGNAYAEEVVLKEEASAEKRGVVKIDDDLLFFCIDMVTPTTFVEIKMVEDEDKVEEWYLLSSIMQSAFYATLLTKVKTLDTPKFRKKEGYQQEVILVNSPKFELWFGKRRFKIYPDERIYEHYVSKLKLVKSCISPINFDECRVFDDKYKHKEFTIFHPEFQEYRLLKTNNYEIKI